MSALTFTAYKNQGLVLEWLVCTSAGECMAMCTSAHTCQSEAVTITSVTLCRQSGLKPFTGD